MARDVVYGILLQAKDGVSNVLRDVGAQAKKTFETDISDSVDSAKEQLEFMSIAVTGVNQALEIGKKAWEVFRSAMEQTLTKTLEYRTENDKQKRDWLAMIDTLNELGATFGDIVLPLLLAIGDAIGENVVRTNALVKENKALIGTGLAEWLAAIAQALSTGIATSVIVVSRAWTGWREIIVLSGQALATVLEKGADFINWVLNGAKALAELSGQEDKVADVERWQKLLSNFSDAWSDMGDQGTVEIARLIREQEELEAQIDRVQTAIADGLGRFQQAAAERMAEKIDRLSARWFRLRDAILAARTAQLRAQQEAVEGERALNRLRDELALQAQLRTQEIEDKALSGLEAVEQQQRESVERLTGSVEAMVSATNDGMSNLFDTLTDDTLSTRDKLVQAITEAVQHMALTTLQFTQTFMQQQAVQRSEGRRTALENTMNQIAPASAKAIEAHSWIPYVGLAIGIAQAAAMTAQIIAFAAQLNGGGQVQQDGLAFLHRNELVIPPERVTELANVLPAAGVRTPVETRSSGGAGMRETNINVRVENRSLAPITSNAEWQYAYDNSIIPTMQRVTELNQPDFLATE